MAVSTADEIRALLASTTLAPDLVDRRLDGAPPLWLASASAQVLATDVALTHPALAADEVRAVARELVTGAHRLTVVAHDRPGLLADTAAAVTGAGCGITDVSAATWSGDGLALHALTVTGASPARFDDVGTRLRAAAGEARAAIRFLPAGPATVRCWPETEGRAVVTVDALDRDGLFATACAWLADQGIGIEAVHAETHVGGRVHDVFLTDAAPDAGALSAALGERPSLPRRLVAVAPTPRRAP